MPSAKDGEKKLRGIFEKVKGSGEYWIRYADETCKIRREKAGSKSFAKDLLASRKAAVLEGRKLPTLRKKGVTFGQIANDALGYSRTHKLSASDDEQRMELLLEWFGNAPADSLKPLDIQRKLIAAKETRNWTEATFNRYRSLISLAYRIAVENGGVQSNPIRLVRRLRENNSRTRFLSVVEETRLREVIEPTHPERWAQVLFAIHTGLRAGEQAGLKWADVLTHTDPPQVQILLSKNGEKRHVPLNAEAQKALDTAKAHAVDGQRVFLPQPYRVWFEIALKAAGIEEFTWHDLRHTFASRLVMSGVDIRTVAQLMGHKTLQMSMRYAHLAPKHLAEAVAKIVGDAETATGTKTSTSIKKPSTGKLILFPEATDNPQVTKITSS